MDVLYVAYIFMNKFK